MQAHAEKAYNILKEMGAPVHIRNGDTCHFCISGEDNCEDDDCTLWADYYEYSFGEFGVNTKITSVLDHFGLMAEWENPGNLQVWNS